MNCLIVLPVPLDSDEVWNIFRSPVKRFCDTWRLHPPGYKCLVAAVTCNGDADRETQEMFDGIPVDFIRYDGDGADIGAAQRAARIFNDSFIMCCTSRVYFHCEGWLRRLVVAREAVGPGLFGAFASKEGGRLHIGTRGHCLDASDLNDYPTKIESRNQGVYFECGEGCLLDYMEAKGRPAMVVGWGGVYSRAEWFQNPNGFRKGDQSDCLFFDRHTQIWENADEAERKRLTALMVGA